MAPSNNLGGCSRCRAGDGRTGSGGAGRDREGASRRRAFSDAAPRFGSTALFRFPPCVGSTALVRSAARVGLSTRVGSTA